MLLVAGPPTVAQQVAFHFYRGTLHYLLAGVRPFVFFLSIAQVKGREGRETSGASRLLATWGFRLLGLFPLGYDTVLASTVQPASYSMLLQSGFLPRLCHLRIWIWSSHPTHPSIHPSVSPAAQPSPAQSQSRPLPAPKSPGCSGWL